MWLLRAQHLMLNKTIAQTQSYAAILIRDGMRIALAHSITGIARGQLLDLRKSIHGDDAPMQGRMPNDTMGYIKSGQSPVALATVVAVYLDAERKRRSPVEAFMDAWSVAKLFADGATPIDINAAWYAVRDVKSGWVSWNFCRNCKAGYLLDTKQTKKTDNCPYCGMQKQKRHEVAQ